MGKKHAAALSALSKTQAEEEVREAETRRGSAERERQLLSSYLGTPDQVAGAGAFGGGPDTLKYARRYTLDPQYLRSVQQSHAGLPGITDPLVASSDATRGGLSIEAYGGKVTQQANDLLAQAEAAARAGDIATADRLFAQGQAIIGGLGQSANAFNLLDDPESAAKLRASSNEARIVGRQLLTARELGDPNSATSQQLRGRLLDPTLGEISGGATNAVGEINSSEQQALKAIDENTRNAERAIASERSQVEGEIRQRAASGGVGFNARAQLAQQARVASEASLARAQVYTEAARQSAGIASEAGLTRAQIREREGAARAAATQQVSLYLSEFAKRMAEDSVTLAQEWVSGVAGVRDQFQGALDQLAVFQAEMANQWAQIYFQDYQRIDAMKSAQKAKTRDLVIGASAGLLTGGLGFIGGATAAALGGASLGGALKAGAEAFTGVFVPPRVGEQSARLPTTPGINPNAPRVGA